MEKKIAEKADETVMSEPTAAELDEHDKAWGALRTEDIKEAAHPQLDKLEQAYVDDLMRKDPALGPLKRAYEMEFGALVTSDEATQPIDAFERERRIYQAHAEYLAKASRHFIERLHGAKVAAGELPAERLMQMVDAELAAINMQLNAITANGGPFTPAA